MESIELNSIEQSRTLVEKQNAELEAMVSNTMTQSVFRGLMQANLAGFMFLTQNERRLVVKFLIESIDELENSI